MMKFLLVTGLLVASSLSVSAQGMVEDTDGDGVFSMDELKAAYPDLTEDTFSVVDTNADGVIDAEELAVAIGAGVLAS
ncbi:EF-hand domain-containing protein [Tropicimonas sp. TH_r6]|uniref:EF-hand domain-containing protein n=1 Tax=Tropicimonas sp. TH_r6 TaxID=3082085 RepID=UPI00295317F2|nr:EF-hand domain-containing protein [Tropicimonas sp. TH_r6]MDV7145515.1 EF-hand domain-containing protein [Tropicimonas sp. TH_r6]